MNKRCKLLFILLTLMLLAAASTFCGKGDGQEYVFPDNTDTTSNPDLPGAKKRMFLWCESYASLPDYLEDPANIARDLRDAADAGFTDIVIDVRPTSGDLLYRSSHCPQVEWLGAWHGGSYNKYEWPASYDFLQKFIDEGEKVGLKVYAGFNTFVCGHSGSLGSTGIVYRDEKAKAWATMLNTDSGIKSILDVDETAKFLNPANLEAQDYLISLLKDLAAYGDKGLAGIILDRGRFRGAQSDFSDYTRAAFESYLGTKVEHWPEDVLPIGYSQEQVPSPTPIRFKQWNEFRAKTIHDFMQRAKAAVKGVDAKLDFGAYVGGWYSTYWPNGVNWASPRFDAGKQYPSWASDKYKDYGFADLMDVLIIGAYAGPGSVFGAGEWTMEGFCRLASEKTKGDAGTLVGGPDVGNWDVQNLYDLTYECNSITQSVKACANACDGYFLFDIIHLKSEPPKWDAVKKGILSVNGEK